MRKTVTSEGREYNTYRQFKLIKARTYEGINHPGIRDVNHDGGQ